VTINLNAEEYDGGDLRLPEFGRQAYRAPTGGAVVFSCSLLHEALPVTRARATPICRSSTAKRMPPASAIWPRRRSSHSRRAGPTENHLEVAGGHGKAGGWWQTSCSRRPVPSLSAMSAPADEL
jgi:hypothetical protein